MSRKPSKFRKAKRAQRIARDIKRVIHGAYHVGDAHAAMATERLMKYARLAGADDVVVIFPGGDVLHDQCLHDEIVRSGTPAELLTTDKKP